MISDLFRNTSFKNSVLMFCILTSPLTNGLSLRSLTLTITSTASPGATTEALGAKHVNENECQTNIEKQKNNWLLNKFVVDFN